MPRFLTRLREALSMIIAALSRARLPTSGGTPPTVPYLNSLVLTGDTTGVVTHDTGAYSVAGFDQNGLPFVGAPGPYTWTSGTPATASISNLGIASPLAAGTTAITVKATNSRGTIITSNAVTLTVSAQVATTVDVDPDSATIASGTEQFTAVVYDQVGIPNPIVGASVSWDTSNHAVATINGSGLATAVVDGSVTVTATSGSASGTATLVISSSTVTAVSIQYNSAPADYLLMRTGTAYPFVAKDQSGNTLSNVGTWSAVDNTNFPINSTSGSVTPITAAAGQGTTFTYFHTATGHTATCVATAVAPVTTKNADYPTNYANNQALLANVASTVGVNTSYNSNVPTGNSSSKYNDGVKCNQITIDTNVLFMGNKTFGVNIPAGGGGPSLRGVIGSNLTRAWAIMPKRFAPGFTFVGVPNVGGAGYKDGLWFTLASGSASGRVGMLYGNGGSNNGTNGAPGGSIDNDTYLESAAHALLGGKNETNVGNITTEFSLGEWWIDILLFEIRAGNILSSRSWRTKIGTDVGNPLGGLQEGPFVAGQAATPTGTFSAFGENYNQNPPNALLKSLAFWEIVDGTAYGDPYGILGTQATPTLTGISGGTITEGDTGDSLVLTGTNFNDNCYPVFSNTGIKAQSIARSGSTQFTVVVNFPLGGSVGVGTVAIYNAASQVTTSTQVVTVQALAAPGAPTASNATAVSFNTLTFPITLNATGTLPTTLPWRYRVTGSGNPFTDGTAIALSNPSLGQSFNQALSLPAASTSYDVQVAAANNGGTSAYSSTVTGTTGAAAAVITTNMVFRARADAGLDVSTDGAAVGTVTDQSPAALGAVLFQGTASKKPILRTAVYNGHNTIRFTSASQMNLTSNAAIPSLNTDQVTHYIVAASRVDNPSGSQRLWNNFNANGGAAYEGFHVTHTSGTNTVDLFAGPSVSGAIAQLPFSTGVTVASGLHVFTTVVDHGAGTYQLYYDGILVRTTSRAYNTQTTNPSVVSIGSQNGSSNFADLDVSDTIQYNVAHSGAQVAQNVSALKTTYGIA